MFLVLIFLWHPNGIQVKDIVIGLGKPKNRFMAAGKFFPGMESMLSCPDNAIYWN